MTEPQIPHVAGSTSIVSIDKVHPNKHNYNVQTSEVFDKLVANIRQFGFIEPIIVRSVGSGAEKEIVNGEHRFHAAKHLGMTEVPIMDLGFISDAKAKQLCITLNELGGRPDQVKLADLLRDIHIDEGVSIDDLQSIMPYSEKELRLLVEAVDLTFANLSSEDPRDSAPANEEHGQQPAAPGKRSVVLSLDHDVAERFLSVAATPEKALEKLLDHFEAKPKKSRKSKQAEMATPEQE